MPINNPNGPANYGNQGHQPPQNQGYRQPPQNMGPQNQNPQNMGQQGPRHPGTTTGITTPRAPMAGNVPNGASRRPDTSWVRTGQAGAQQSQQVTARQEQRRAEARERGYFPPRFRVKVNPGPSGQDHIGHLIILDHEPGPRYWEHNLKNPRNGFNDIFEPCAKEFENCPLCPPSGSQESSWVMLLSVLNLKGYVKSDTGVHVHPTKELLAVKSSQHSVFDRLFQTYGSLRGLQLTMVRDGDKSPSIGNIDPVSQIVKHTDQDIVSYLQQTGKWAPRLDREGKQIEPQNWMSVPFDYFRFLHKPEALRLRRLYGGAAPMGAQDYNPQGYGGGYGSAQDDQGQWDQSQTSGGYMPNAAQPPSGHQHPAGYDPNYQPPMDQGGHHHDYHNPNDADYTQNPGPQGQGYQEGGEIRTRSRVPPGQARGGQPGGQPQQGQQSDENWTRMNRGNPGMGGGQAEIDDEIPF